MTQKWYRYGEALKKEIAHTKPPFPMSAIWPLGGAAICIRTSSHVYLFDPIFRTEEAVTTPFRPDASLNIDYVFLGGYHSMTQVQSLRMMAMVSDRTQFIVPAPHIHSLEGSGLPADRLFGAKPFQLFTLDGAQVVPVCEDSGSAQEGSDLGYAIRVPGMVLYHSANTGRILDPEADLSGLDVDVISAAFPGREESIGSLASRMGCDLVLPLFTEDVPAGSVPGGIPCRYHELMPGEKYFYLK